MSRGQLSIALLAATETLRISVPTIVDGWLGRGSRARHDARLRAWATRLLDHAQVTLEVDGTFPSGGPFVVMSNHQSMYDIPVMYRIYPHCLRMVAKRELFSTPIWGRALRTAEFIAIDRRNHTAARKSLVRAQAQMADGIHIWISPEGTRSPGRELGAFKRGGFRLAASTHAPILPITIDGTHHVMPKGAWTVTRGCSVYVRVHDAVDPRDYGLVNGMETSTDAAPDKTNARGLEDLMADVRRRITSGLRSSMARGADDVSS